MTLAHPPQRDLTDITVRPMTAADIDAVVALADQVVGQGYYTAESVATMLTRSTVGDVVCSHVATRARPAADAPEPPAPTDAVLGFRFSLPPGRWQHGRGQGLSPERWPAPLAQAAYFQTAYVANAARGRGVGPRMAAAALDALRQLGARVVVTHSWKESPDNSSFRYLTRLGFVPVAEYPDYWIDVDYTCVRDGRPCRCTAIEMVLPLDAPAASAREGAA